MSTRPGVAMPAGTEPLRSEIRIEAPPEVVFPYFTDPTRMVHWMGVAALLDPRPGGTFRVEANGRDVVLGEYVELDPPHRVVFTRAGRTVSLGSRPLPPVARWKLIPGSSTSEGATMPSIHFRTTDDAPYFTAGAPVPR